MVDRLVPSEKIRLTDEEKEQLVKACQGLSRCRIARVLAKCLAAVCGCHQSRNKISHRGESVRPFARQEFLNLFLLQAGLESMWAVWRI